jgi:transcriptional regulator with XRE-family HTH domain
MQSALTSTAAKELGRAVRFVRHARSMTLRDVAARSGLSSQYIQNIERGERTTVSEDAYMRFATAVGVPDETMLDLILRARVQSALERRGLTLEQVTFVWRGVEQRLTEVGVDMRTDLTKVVTDILA